MANISRFLLSHYVVRGDSHDWACGEETIGQTRLLVTGLWSWLHCRIQLGVEECVGDSGVFLVKRRSILYKAVVPFFVFTFLPRVTWNLNFEVPHVESMWVKLDPTSISIGSNLDFFRKKIFGDIFFSHASGCGSSLFRGRFRMAFESFRCQGELCILCFWSCDANTFFRDDSETQQTAHRSGCQYVPDCASCEFDGDMQLNLDQREGTAFQLPCTQWHRKRQSYAVFAWHFSLH